MPATIITDTALPAAQAQAQAAVPVETLIPLAKLGAAPENVRRAPGARSSHAPARSPQARAVGTDDGCGQLLSRDRPAERRHRPVMWVRPLAPRSSIADADHPLGRPPSRRCNPWPPVLRGPGSGLSRAGSELPGAAPPIPHREPRT